jgi:hypothetical protein
MLWPISVLNWLVLASKGPLIIYCTGGIEEKLGGGPLNFFKHERGALKKYRETKEGGALKIFTSFKIYHKTNYYS